MKEIRFFYTPAPQDGELPADEARHATRVLRLQMGDEIHLMDGQGTFHRAVITEATNHRCRYRIDESQPQQPEWKGGIHLAVAPTKNMDRIEWLAEQATEVGMDHLSLLDCRFSERHVVKTDRLQKIIVASMKQSRKAWLPQLDEMTPFARFIARPDLPAQRFIAHCYPMEDIGTTSVSGGEKPFLHDVLLPQTPAVVLIGPEGDFAVDEVRAAEAAGFRSVSLGSSRLRTETAALTAIFLMRLANRLTP